MKSTIEQPQLSLRHVGMNFGGVQALQDVSFEVSATEGFVGIIGPNGSGKSTLLNVISGVYRASRGEVFHSGRDVTFWAPARRASVGLSRTFQHVQLAQSLTLGQNVMLAAERAFGYGSIRRGDLALEEQAADVMDLFGLSGFEERLPEEVPYGLRRMTEVARAILPNPELLLLDEPAAGLNDSERARLIAGLRKFQEKRSSAVCLIEHDVALVRNLCPRLIVLDEGRLLADGETAGVLMKDTVRDAYLGRERV